MLTIRIRWKVIYEVVCLIKHHDWQEYAVIHPGWNRPGKYCTRCKKSVVRHYKNYNWNNPEEAKDRVTEETESWFSVKVK